MASKPYGTLYIGVTSDLVRRVYQRKAGVAEGFTKSHDVKYLVYFEVFEQIEDAIVREKAMKEWKRQWKVNLIQKENPEWRDIYPDIATP